MTGDFTTVAGVKGHWLVTRSGHVRIKINDRTTLYFENGHKADQMMKVIAPHAVIGIRDAGE